MERGKAIGGGILRGLTVVAAALVFSASAGAQELPGEYATVTGGQREAVMDTLAGFGLDTDVLDSLNLTTNQAEWVIWTARQWYGNNEQSLQTARAAVAQGLTSYRLHRGADRNGVAEARAQMRTAAAAVDTARSGVRSVCSSLKTAVAAHLSDSQRALWATMEANTGRSMPLRVVALTDRQADTIEQATDLRASMLADADTAQERAAARTAYSTTIGNTLTQDQRAMVAAYHENISAGTQRVRDAIDRVLPVTE